MVEDTRKVQNEKVVMLRAGSGEAVNPRRVAGAKIVMTSGVIPNMQAKTTTVTPPKNDDPQTDGTTGAVEITPDSGYSGMSKVNVSTPQLHDFQKFGVLGVTDAGHNEYDGDMLVTTTEKTLKVSPTKVGMGYPTGSYLIHPSSAMGDAQPADVLSGKTFTSASGIAQVGTGSGTGNLQVKTTTVTPAQNEDPQTDGTTQAVEITPDSGYSGMSKVNVSTPQLHHFQKFAVESVSDAGGDEYVGDTLVTTTEKTLKISPSKQGMGYPTDSYRIHPSSVMGNATAADVRQGKTFTSGSGIAQTGSLVVPVHIYGATWDGSSSPAWTRTDGAANFSDPNPYYSGMSGTPSSPFDSIMPWAGMRKLNMNNLSDMTLVEIPKYWYKWTRSGASMQLQISNQAETGFYVSPAHADRGDGVGERDYVYVGRYHCNVAYNMGRSQTGVSPSTNMTRADFRTKIHNSGSIVWQWDFPMFWTIAMLYIVEFANWNSQAMIGYGCGNGSSVQNTGASDTMPYHTGTMQSSRSTYGVGVQYRYIEDLWANVRDFVDGIRFYGTSVYCINNPSNFSDTQGGTSVGYRASDTGNIKTFTDPSASGYEYALMPSTVDINESLSNYVCDMYYYNNQGKILITGWTPEHYQNAGLFDMFTGYAEDWTHATGGSRLMVLPSAQLT